MSSQEDINDSSPDSAGSNAKDAAIFEPKAQTKIIRVLTVLAYVLSVSMAAILLSVYYIFMWNGQPQLGAQKSFQIGLSNSSEELYSNNITLNYFVEDKSIYRNFSVFNESVIEQERKEVTEEAESISNLTLHNRENRDVSKGMSSLRERQRQMTDLNIKEFTVLPTETTTGEETTTWINYESKADFDEFSKKSIFMNKILFNQDYDGND